MSGAGEEVALTRFRVADDDAAARHGVLDLPEAGGRRATGFDSGTASPARQP